jgi:hypothetical protein
MEAICSFETLADFQQTTWHCIPEHSTLHNHHCENLQSYKLLDVLIKANGGSVQVLIMLQSNYSCTTSEIYHTEIIICGAYSEMLTPQQFKNIKGKVLFSIVLCENFFTCSLGCPTFKPFKMSVTLTINIKLKDPPTPLKYINLMSMENLTNLFCISIYYVLLSTSPIKWEFLTTICYHNLFLILCYLKGIRVTLISK